MTCRMPTCAFVSTSFLVLIRHAPLESHKSSRRHMGIYFYLSVHGATVSMVLRLSQGNSVNKLTKRLLRPLQGKPS